MYICMPHACTHTSMCLFTYPSIHLPAYLFPVYLSVCPSVYRTIQLSICLFISFTDTYLSIHLSVRKRHVSLSRDHKRSIKKRLTSQVLVAVISGSFSFALVGATVLQLQEYSLSMLGRRRKLFFMITISCVHASVTIVVNCCCPVFLFSVFFMPSYQALKQG